MPLETTTQIFLRAREGMDLLLIAIGEPLAYIPDTTRASGLAAPCAEPPGVPATLIHSDELPSLQQLWGLHVPGLEHASSMVCVPPCTLTSSSHLSVRIC